MDDEGGVVRLLGVRVERFVNVVVRLANWKDGIDVCVESQDETAGGVVL